jgi:hypothetical protein
MQQNAITALAVASQNEDLQQALNNTRQELLKAQKETYDLRTKLTESQEEVTRLEGELTQRSTAQNPNNDYGTNQGRGNGQPQQMANPTAPGVYQAPSYQHANNQLYQNHPAPSQGNSTPALRVFRGADNIEAAHTRAPTYSTPNNRPPVNWAQQPPVPVYGYQSTQPQSSMWNTNIR